MTTTEELSARYTTALHKIQAGVAALMGYAETHGERYPEAEPKHLRVGVNSALLNVSAVGELLVEKGIVTEDELAEKIVEYVEREAEVYRERVQAKFPGTEITLV